GVGVWVVPGWHGNPLAHQDTWIEVEIYDMSLYARGWLDTASFGHVFVPQPPPAVHDHIGILQGAWILESPQGARIAHLTPLDSGAPGFLHWFDDLGSPVQGFRKVRYGGFQSWIQGYVPQSHIRRRPPATGYGRGQGGNRGYGTRTALPLPLTLQVAPGTDLFDAPRGDLCGRTRAVLRIPDRLPLRIEGGRREIEVPMQEAGYFRVWVEEGKVSPVPSANDGEPVPWPRALPSSPTAPWPAPMRAF
ncbi:MAG: hypothetical protein RMJ98_04300, partial [Myxococcales bacterium]|nr:hypothetical protein [Polyangiaceae bacterium]MDW8248512.1 hypothetical protein [Myxococcales bacterium]